MIAYGWIANKTTNLVNGKKDELYELAYAMRFIVYETGERRSTNTSLT
jgi:hypothetical protein